MPPHFQKLNIKVKIWIENADGQMVFGFGRLRILEAIERCGSILAAAKELDMSYRAVLGKIKASEQRLGQPLVRKHIGGPQGGGSQLTPFAKILVERFRQLYTVSQTTSQALFKGLFIDSMDAAIFFEESDYGR